MLNQDFMLNQDLIKELTDEFFADIFCTFYEQIEDPESRLNKVQSFIVSDIWHPFENDIKLGKIPFGCSKDHFERKEALKEAVQRLKKSGFNIQWNQGVGPYYAVYRK